MTMWPALRSGDVEQVITDIHGPRRALSDLGGRKDYNDTTGTIEMGMKTAETQTELIDESPNSPIDFQVINEGISSTSDNNNKARLNINSLKDMKDIKCIDDDSASGHRILFTRMPDNPETKL